jgi:hypothetical protein
MIYLLQGELGTDKHRRRLTFLSRHSQFRSSKRVRWACLLLLAIRGGGAVPNQN